MSPIKNKYDAARLKAKFASLTDQMLKHQYTSEIREDQRVMLEIELQRRGVQVSSKCKLSQLSKGDVKALRKLEQFANDDRLVADTHNSRKRHEKPRESKDNFRSDKGQE